LVKLIIILSVVFLTFGCSNDKIIPDIKNFSNDKNATFLSCFGQDLKFLGGKVTNDYEPFWTDVVIINDLLVVPKFGEYKLKDEADNRKLWWISNADTHKSGWAELNSDTGKFIATNKTREFQAKCVKKIKESVF
jgi:hypothetical protein